MTEDVKEKKEAAGEPVQKADEAPEKEATVAEEPAMGAEAEKEEEKAESAKEEPEKEKQDEASAGKSARESFKDRRAAKKGKKLSPEEEKILSLEEEIASQNDRYLRLCAEYDNFRKRTQKEKDALYGEIRANTLLQFLPVYDNLERALKQGTEDEAYRKGVEMIMTQFCSTIEKLGVTEVPALGEKFNPELHNAVMHVDDEEKGENEVVEVFQKGFMLGDKVIRFAMVKVAN